MVANADKLKQFGGELCLAFTDTTEWRASDQQQESLTSYARLVSWSQRVGILTDAQADRLLREADGRPTEAGAVLERAILLRETAYRIFSTIAKGQPPGSSDLDRLNSALTEALVRLQVIPTVGGFAWDWKGGNKALDRMLWPVVRSAADLLTSARLDRVKECAGGCTWLFLDMSRNRSRRWCTMRVCGNRAKARRHYQRGRRQRTNASG
jgi:predicted RNA-binding Zn ribbon-like protein